MGFPTTKAEDWKYTSVSPIADIPFRPVGSARTKGEACVTGIPFLRETPNRLVFLDGRFLAAHSRLGDLAPGVVIANLAGVVETRRGVVERHLGAYARVEEHPFVALNTAFVADGAFIYLPPGTLVADPVELFFVSSAPAQPVVIHPRVLVVAEAESRLTVAETYVGHGEHVYFTNAVTEIALGPGAQVTHCRVQEEAAGAFHIGVVVAGQDRDSHFYSLSLSTGALLARHDIRTLFSAPGGQCRLDGLYLAEGRQHVDHHTLIDHRAPQCTSEELYKGVLDGRATAVFNGKVLVRPDAQKSDAHQTNKNLLLSEDAVVNTKPQLEIFADDVKCSHGATIGCLDESALFYLRSRGIDETVARRILIRGFADEVLERVPVEDLRVVLQGRVRSRLRGPELDGEDG